MRTIEHWSLARSTSFKRRLAMVLQRTLRRQAQEFLDRPFTQRRCRLYEYAMSDAERSLYDDVTEYLLEPSLYAFAGRQRRLLLIGFHRRMASSIPALAASLENVAARLRRLQAGLGSDDTVINVLRDLEDEDEIEEPSEEPAPPIDRATLAAELVRVEEFRRPRAIASERCQGALIPGSDQGDSRSGAGRPRQRQGRRVHRVDHHAGVLADACSSPSASARRTSPCSAASTITSVRSKRSRGGRQEEGARFPPGARPSREVAVRLALVHEFRTRSKVLVCTEAGAKGLNLQFCETVINYDLPWNPQRIEQRIGRCHRYSQQRDVTVVNFIARDNEAHRLTFEILSQKLDLFGRVLDASDHVLHEPRTDAPEILVSALSVEFESDLRSIYSRSRTLDEVTREIAALRDKISERRDAFEKEYERTSQIIESRFDENVRRVFKRLREDLPDSLADLDRDLAELVDGYLTARGVAYRRSDEAGRVVFDVAPGAALPVEVGDGRRFATGDARALTDAESLNLVHPLVRAAIAQARTWSGGGSVTLQLPPDSSPDLAALAGKSGAYLRRAGRLRRLRASSAARRGGCG